MRFSYLVDLMTFSSFVRVETEIGEFPLDVDGAGRRSRSNRIGFLSFVEDVSFDDENKRRLDGAEHGNGISKDNFFHFLPGL
jgi:hypothetical protein